LMMAVDASYEFGFGVTVYQVPADSMVLNEITPQAISEGKYDRRLDRVVMFLSKELSAAETAYWPTELETSALVFAVKKTRHLVEANDFPTVIYSDHVAVKHIAHSTSLKTVSPERANMRLIRASQYLSQFRLDVRYRPGKDNIPADALSRIKHVETTADIFTVSSDIIPSQDRPAGAHSTIQMDADFIHEWSTALKEDKHYRTIYSELYDKLDDQSQSESYRWIMKLVQGYPLLFVQKGSDGLRACIPSDLVKRVMQTAHDRDHPGIENSFARIRDHFYMPGLSSVVREYISTCPECARKRTVRHKPYGNLQPIAPPVNPFDTITIDFIVKLPESGGYDSILTITDKVSRAVIFAPGKETWTAVEWADVLLDAVTRRWGVPSTIISDRGSVFVSELWRNLFKKLGVSLLFSTAYHPQTDGQSEATNQYLQTVLRFFVNERQDDWADFLGEAEFIINNATSSSTKMAPNEILFGFKLRDPITALGQQIAAGTSNNSHLETAPIRRTMARAQAEDASRHASYHMARQYNKRHKDISFAVGDKVYIRLGNGYKLQGIPKAKLGDQRTGPFEVLEKVGKLAYKLDLPPAWRIHPVLSVAQLELFRPDPFNRTTAPPKPIVVDGEEEYEVEAIIKSAMRGRGANREKHYLVRWKGYGPASDEWIPARDMEHAPDIVQEFENRGRAMMSFIIH
jgi:Integrase zinc binding domain/RNase H-like domain found in reverse transcriptase/Integrase core domain/Chromo (CHRromatin Organisation MOdifier) domain